MYEGFEFPQCSLARGVPFSRKVESVEEARKFGVGPSNLVSFENTEYHVLKDACMQTDPVLWAHTVSMWDNRLLPAVLEVQRVEAVIIGNARKRFTEAENRNTPLFSRLSELVKEEADLRGKVRVAIVDSSQAVPIRLRSLQRHSEYSESNFRTIWCCRCQTNAFFTLTLPMPLNWSCPMTLRSRNTSSKDGCIGL